MENRTGERSFEPTPSEAEQPDPSTPESPLVEVASLGTPSELRRPQPLTNPSMTVKA
jgi:hypothetical protein